MKLSKLSTKSSLWIFAGAFLLGAGPSFAADKDDIYGEAQLGARLEQISKAQFGGVLGYCPMDSIGFGLGVEQAIALGKIDNNAYATQIFLDARWFLEPFELYAGLGALRSVNSQNLVDLESVLLTGANYLWALTPSLAAKFEFRAQFTYGSKTSLFTGVGARVLY